MPARHKNAIFGQTTCSMSLISISYILYPSLRILIRPHVVDSFWVELLAADVVGTVYLLLLHLLKLLLQNSLSKLQ